MRNVKMLAVLAVLVAGVTVGAETLRIDGSTTVGPIADAFAEYFKTVQPGLEITVNKTGSGNGATALIEGRCDIATLSRFMKEEEFKKAVEKGVLPVAHRVGMDGIVLVVHPSNPIKELKAEQVRSIYQGKIKNWKELGGADVAIVAISRDTSSGTYEGFHEMVMKKQDMAPGIEQVSANPQMHARVSSTAGAIGYVGMGFVDAKVKGLKFDGVEPKRETVLNGTYPLSRPLFFFTNGYPQPGSTVLSFVSFYLTEKGQELVEAKGFVPVTKY
jgi:phosphate transport system substrate-binding protein